LPMANPRSGRAPTARSGDNVDRVGGKFASEKGHAKVS
jgi:hypothetical protein